MSVAICNPDSGFGEDGDYKPRVRECKSMEGKSTVARGKDWLFKFLRKGYADWMTMLMRSMDKITGLVSISLNSSKS